MQRISKSWIWLHIYRYLTQWQILNFSKQWVLSSLLSDLTICKAFIVPVRVLVHAMSVVQKNVITTLKDYFKNYLSISTKATAGCMTQSIVSMTRIPLLRLILLWLFTFVFRLFLVHFRVSLECLLKFLFGLETRFYPSNQLYIFSLIFKIRWQVTISLKICESGQEIHCFAFYALIETRHVHSKINYK